MAMRMQKCSLKEMIWNSFPVVERDIMNVFSTFKFRIICVIAALIVAVSIFLTYTSIRQIHQVSENVFGDQGRIVLDKASKVIDAERFSNLAASLDRNDPYYDILYEKLYEIKQFYSCRFLYTMTRVNGTEFAYVVDGSTVETDEENFSPIGTIEDISSYGEAPFDCYDNMRFAASHIENQEDWGKTISVYSPIMYNGKIVGMLACDFDAEKLSATIDHSSRNMIIGCAICLVVVILAMWLYIGNFFRKIARVSNAMDVISSGARDLTARVQVSGNNEISMLASSCNKVMASLQEVIGAEKKSVEGLALNSHELMNQTSQNLSAIATADESVTEIYEKAQAQSSLIDKAISVINEYVKSVNELDGKTKAQENAIEESSQSVDAIMDNIKVLTNALENISEEYKKIVIDTRDGREKQKIVVDKISQVQELAENLNSANSVITQISSQTNLLAMNAAIEAAHAGTAGKGFSVVAEEIRKLSETSATQTKSVSELLEAIESSIAGIANASDNSTQSFDVLGERIRTLDNDIINIREKIERQSEEGRKIKEMMGIISDASNMISQSSGMIKKKNKVLESHIEELHSSANEILMGSEVSKEYLKRMQESTSRSADKSRQNLGLCEEVRSIVNSYKTV